MNLTSDQVEVQNRSIVAIDPGNKESALACFDHEGQFVLSAKMPNEDIIEFLRCGGYKRKLVSRDFYFSVDAAQMLVVEGIACYGMAVGAEVFDTCFWSGRFVQAYGKPFVRVYRQDVKLHLCRSNRAKDANVRQAIIDKYGGKESAIGKKSKPGPLYGVAGDQWAAIAVGITYLETTPRGVGDGHEEKTNGTV